MTAEPKPKSKFDSAKTLLGHAAMLAKKQAELGKISSILLPRLFQEIGKRVYSLGDSPADLVALCEKIRRLESQLEAKLASSDAEGSKGFSGRTKELVARVSKAAGDATISVQLSAAFTALGREAVRLHGDDFIPSDLKADYSSLLVRQGALKSEIDCLSAKTGKGVMTPKRVAIAGVVFCVFLGFFAIRSAVSWMTGNGSVISPNTTAKFAEGLAENTGFRVSETTRVSHEKEERQSEKQISADQKTQWDDCVDLESVLSKFGGSDAQSLARFCRYLTPENAEKAEGDSFDREEAEKFALKQRDTFLEAMFVIQGKATWDQREPEKQGLEKLSLEKEKDDSIRLRVPLFFNVQIKGKPEFIGKSQYFQNLTAVRVGDDRFRGILPPEADRLYKNGRDIFVPKKFDKCEILLHISGEAERLKAIARNADELIVNLFVSSLHLFRPGNFDFYMFSWRDILQNDFDSQNCFSYPLAPQDVPPFLRGDFFLNGEFPRAVLKRVEVIRATPSSREVILDWKSPS